MTSSPADPLSLLHTMEAASSHRGRVSAVREQIEEGAWCGFVLAMDPLHLVVPFTEGEVLPAGEITPLPLSRPWVAGMINLRGDIHTVVDFAHFLGLPAVAGDGTTHLFLPATNPLGCALLMERPIRLRTFPQPPTRGGVPGLEQAVAPYVRSACMVEGELWGVLDIAALMEAGNFAHIGR